MEFDGKLITQLPLQEGTSAAGKAWKKQEWVFEQINTNSQYTNHIVVQAFGEERINRLNLEVGKSYTVSVDIESREWNGRWFTNVSAYAAREIASSGAGMSQQEQQFASNQPMFGQQAPVASAPIVDETDDLPF